jgi:hypothetical protein
METDYKLLAKIDAFHFKSTREWVNSPISERSKNLSPVPFREAR